MTLFDHYLEYMTQLLEGRRSPPEGITLPEGDVTEKAASLSRQLQQMGPPPLSVPAPIRTALRCRRKFTGRRTIPQAFSSCCKAPHSRPPYRRLLRRRSPPRRPRIPMQVSTPSRCFWTAWRWMTVWCST